MGRRKATLAGICVLIVAFLLVWGMAHESGALAESPTDPLSTGPDARPLHSPPRERGRPALRDPRSEAQSQRVLLIHDSSAALSQKLYSQVIQALDYAKIAHDDVDIGQTLHIDDLESYSAIAVTTESIWRFDEKEALKIKEFVAEGGGLAMLVRAWHPALKETFGVFNQQEPDYVMIDSGIHFTGDFLPGLKDLTVKRENIGDFSAMDMVTLDDAEALAASGDGRYPLLWRYKFGQGRVVYWNNDLLVSKGLRGFAVQSVMDVHGKAVMALANVGLFHIDDFPAPAPAGKIEPVASEYDLSVVDFYHQVWFPDMMSLARKYDLRYLWIIPFNYNGRIAPPWDFKEWTHAKIEVNGQETPFCTYLSHQVAQGDHELALHGYCHQSLRLDWWKGDTDNMVAALEIAKERWQEDGLGPLPFSYVAPNNLYDAAGLAALHEAFPSVKVVGSVSSGAFEGGGNREFGPEPWNENFFSIPRWSDGYFDEPYTRLTILSHLNTMGTWVHFLHPDDILNTSENYPTETDPRNPHNAPWRGDPSDSNDGMFDQMNNLLAWGEENYSWLRWMTTQDSYTEFVNYFNTDAAYTFDDNEITIRFTGQPTYLLVRLNDGRKLDLRQATNVQIIDIHAGEGYNQYILRGMNEEVRLGLLDGE